MVLPFSARAAALPFLRGVNFTAEGRGGYTAETAAPMLDKLAASGVNSVALVPYGFHRPGTGAIRYNMGMEADDRIRDVSAAVRKAGMKLLLKPQLWTPGVFTGDLEFTAEADRTAWFAQYTAFATHHASLAKEINADLYCIANEFGKLSRHEAYWRGLIKQVRGIYSGPLVYAASQGPEFENLRFWDALDYIGLNNYYPLRSDFSAGHLPAIIEKVWSKIRKPVLFTECGYSTFENPHLQPWDESPRQLSPEHQARAYESLLRVVYDKPWLGGMYWWKVGTNGYGGPADGSHTPWNKPAMDVVRRWYRSGKR
ncbi:MAG: hypothetical protein SGI92_11760 [Bryobacteraceae bacterium]|nr:hypothetical protein [Bryobacteraceae bacterium]